ncbi:hypothetical protein CDAR_440441 [Caerostris darwini]|uniref:Uncharacterized protein n=1 Tax=Caerostris darwini TaxID=1538125 RepID=A0AAV4X8H3_9ARAC|nr:hypothetical protein CDAR_440441 [Caerostris darwini]
MFRGRERVLPFSGNDNCDGARVLFLETHSLIRKVVGGGSTSIVIRQSTGCAHSLIGYKSAHSATTALLFRTLPTNELGGQQKVPNIPKIEQSFVKTFHLSPIRDKL